MTANYMKEVWVGSKEKKQINACKVEEDPTFIYNLILLKQQQQTPESTKDEMCTCVKYANLWICTQNAHLQILAH